MHKLYFFQGHQQHSQELLNTTVSFTEEIFLVSIARDLTWM